jgi:predicted  nucleic acid-binding Zn-ribbon protein
VDLQEKLDEERSEVSGLKEAVANLEGKREKLRRAVARQGNDLAETLQQNSELGGLMQQLEAESRLLRQSSDGRKGELARIDAGQPSAGPHLQEAMAAGESKVNVQGELEKMRLEVRGKEFDV